MSIDQTDKIIIVSILGGTREAKPVRVEYSKQCPSGDDGTTVKRFIIPTELAALATELAALAQMLLI